MSENYFVGIDFGGTSVKLALYDNSRIVPVNTTSFTRKPDNYGGSVDALTSKIVSSVADLLDQGPESVTLQDVKGIGMASLGLFKADGTYVVASNLSFLGGNNLRTNLEDTLGIPMKVENDGNAGAIGEHSLVQNDLLYWVFGTGWGGAWINREGNIVKPTLDWDGSDSSLHLTDEPSYATAFDKEGLARMLVNEYGVKSEVYAKVIEPETLSGPNGNLDTIRTEVLISDRGIGKLYLMLENFEGFVTDDVLDSYRGGSVAQLAAQGDWVAERSYQLFGRLLGIAGTDVVTAAINSGAQEDIPIYIAGGMSRSAHLFAWSLMREFSERGIKSYVNKSVAEQQGMNPNQLGALVLAKRAYNDSKK